jgi:hypothetical protein
VSYAFTGPIKRPISVAVEYLTARNDMIDRHRGAGGVLLGNASKPKQLTFIAMCNEFSTRFADEFPNDWNIQDWEAFSRLDMQDMTYTLRLHAEQGIHALAQYEACSELAKTYLALLRMRMTP